MARRKNSRHGSYPGDTGKIPKTKAAFKREYYNLLTEYFSTRQYIGAGKYEKPTAKSLRIADRLAELQDAHPDWAFETDDEWGDDQRMNPSPRRKNVDLAWEIAAKVAKAAHAAMKGGGRWDLGYTPTVAGKRFGDPIQKRGTIYISHQMVDDPIGDYWFVMPLPRNLTESQLKNKLYPLARRWPVLGPKGGLPSVKVLRPNTRRKKSNPRNRKLDIKLPNTNLTVVGVGRDTNGNSVLRVKTPNRRAFSIQTLQLYLVHRLRGSLLLGDEIPSRDMKAFTSEVVDYIKHYGSPAQKKSLRVYKSNPKRRKNADLSASHGFSTAEERRVRFQIKQDLVFAFMRVLKQRPRETGPSNLEAHKIGWGFELLNVYQSQNTTGNIPKLKREYFWGHNASAKARKWLNSVNDSRWETIIRAAAKEAIARHKALSNPSRRKNTHLTVGAAVKLSEKGLLQKQRYGTEAPPELKEWETPRKWWGIVREVFPGGYTVGDHWGYGDEYIADDLLVANVSKTRKFPGTGYRGKTPRRKNAPIRFTKGSVRLLKAKGGFHPSIDAEVVGSWAVHRAYPPPKPPNQPGWVVSFAPTGHKVAWVRGKTEAKDIVRGLIKAEPALRNAKSLKTLERHMSAINAVLDKSQWQYPNPKRRKNLSAINAEILSFSGGGRRSKFGSGPFSPQFKRVRRNSKASRSNLVFFMETGRGKRNIKVYKVGKKYEMVVHERGQPDLTAQTTSKAELSAVVGQFYRVGYMTGEAKYKVKHDALGLGIE